MVSKVLSCQHAAVNVCFHFKWNPFCSNQWCTAYRLLNTWVLNPSKMRIWSAGVELFLHFSILISVINKRAVALVEVYRESFTKGCMQPIAHLLVLCIVFKNSNSNDQSTSLIIKEIIMMMMIIVGTKNNHCSSDHWCSWACQEGNRKLHWQDPWRQHQSKHSCRRLSSLKLLAYVGRLYPSHNPADLQLP